MPSTVARQPLDLTSLRQAYLTRSTTPIRVVAEILDVMQRDPDEGVFIARASEEDLLDAAERAGRAWATGEARTLTGVPFVVNDNIDVAGFPTTAACPDFSYVPECSAVAVQRLLDEGAVCLGKTNVDQFATGLLGLWTPHPPPRNPFNHDVVPGGSSAGAAVAVARGWATFALGTDAAGSGRIPAALNHIVGVKPSRGSVSARGIVPTCRALDCVSVFSLTVADGAEIAARLTAFDPEDPYAVALDPRAGDSAMPVRLGVPADGQLVFSDDETFRLFLRASALCQDLGCELIPLDFSPFFAIAKLLDEGPYAAQRLEATADLLRTSPASFEPTVLTMLERARDLTALEAYRAETLRRTLSQRAACALERVDALLVPSTPGIVRCDDARADPFRLSARLGRYATFANFLDLAALAIPAGLDVDGVPRGVTLIGRPGSDPALARLGALLHGRCAESLGATGWTIPGGLEARVVDSPFSILEEQARRG